MNISIQIENALESEILRGPIQREIPKIVRMDSEETWLE